MLMSWILEAFVCNSLILLLFDDSNDIFIGQLVAQADTLRLMLHRLSVYYSNTEVFNNGLVNGIAKIFDCTLCGT